MKCRCGNTARYVTEFGELTCSVCPLKTKEDSIRLKDVPELLKWARRYLERHPEPGPHSDQLREIVGKVPT